MTSYYRKFVAGYANIARPLTELLKKDKFGWDTTTEQAFNQLKSAMVNPPVLAMPNFTLPFTIETDASGYGVGAVLLQEGRPVAYFSKLLGVRVHQKSIYEKELITICLAVMKWKPYLLGRHFIVKINQQSLRFLTQQREVNPDHQKWVTKLPGFDFEIQYRTGASNRVDDALSRKNSGDVILNTMVTRPVILWEQLEQEIASDKVLRTLREELSTGTREHPGYSLIEGRLYYKERCVIPATSKFRRALLKEYHDSMVGGHVGELKTYLRMVVDWYWPGMRKEITSYVSQCVICQQQKCPSVLRQGYYSLCQFLRRYGVI